jgi:cytochrome c2
MRNQLALATTTALALALTACGSPPEADDAEDVDVSEEVEEVAVEEADGEALEDGEAIEAEAEEPAEDEEEDEAPEPVASATPAPTPTPTQVAAATPPASFSTCGVCHSVEPGQNMIGPTLAGVFGREAGNVAGATYSPAMQGADITWTEANLRRYIVDPSAVVPGGTMPNPGVSAADAQAIVNYLKTL